MASIEIAPAINALSGVRGEQTIAITANAVCHSAMPSPSGWTRLFSTEVDFCGQVFWCDIYDNGDKELQAIPFAVGEGEYFKRVGFGWNPVKEFYGNFPSIAKSTLIISLKLTTSVHCNI